MKRGKKQKQYRKETEEPGRKTEEDWNQTEAV